MSEQAELSVSYSQISTYNRCKYQWQLEYVRRIRRISLHESMDLGSAVHAGLQSHFLGEYYGYGVARWADSMLPQPLEHYLASFSRDDIETFTEMAAEGFTGSFDADYAKAFMVRAIILQANPLIERAIADIGDRWEVLKDDEGKPFVEYEFITPITKTVVFKAKIDLLVRERSTGMVWLVDFKVRSDIGELDPMDFDTQMATYQYLLRVKGIKTTGSMIYQIKAKLPQSPSLNKDGSMSRNKSITTDWPTYKAALLEAGLDPADYADMMTALSQRKFVREDRVYRGEDNLINHWRNTSITMRSLVEDRKRLTAQFEDGLEAPRSISQFNCARCSVQQFCMTEFEGQPTDALMGVSFAKEVR